MDEVTSIVLRRIPIPLQLRLLTAEMRHDSWPLDPISDSPMPMHRVERDGQLIDAWSVGLNGRADGGSQLWDLSIPLSGIMGSPLMGDAPVSLGYPDLWE